MKLNCSCHVIFIRVSKRCRFVSCVDALCLNRSPFVLDHLGTCADIQAARYCPLRANGQAKEERPLERRGKLQAKTHAPNSAIRRQFQPILTDYRKGTTGKLVPMFVLFIGPQCMF